MTVRRLAADQVQPQQFTFNRANAGWVKQTIKKYPKGREASAVIPLLMRAQEQDGWVTRAAIEHVAQMLGMPYIRVLEVATFYTQFQLKPVGTKAHIQVCGTTPCMLRGSEALMDVCRRRINDEQFETNETGTLSWEEVECLGACVNAPMVMVFKDTYEDLTPERLEEIIDAFEAGKGADIATGPQNGRVFSAPVAGLTSLVDETPLLKATRDRETAKAEQSGSHAAAAAAADAQVSPSRAARPKTDAPETNPAIKSPSRVKVDPAREAAESAEAPKGSEAAADRADPAVELKPKQRTHPDKREDAPKAFKAPETEDGAARGPAGKRKPGEKRAPEGKPSPEGTGRTSPKGRGRKGGDEGGAK